MGMRIKKVTSFTLDGEHIEMLKKMAERLNVTASELLDSMIEFYYYNNFAPRTCSARDESISNKGGRVEFIARIHKGKIRIPPTQQFKDGDVVKVTIEFVGEEKEKR
jgi:hypothetical protein